MPFPARTPLPSARGNNTAAAPSKIPALCSVAHELATLLDRETALIRAMRIQEIAPLQAEKARLTKLCGTTLQSIDPATPAPDETVWIDLVAPSLEEDKAVERLTGVAVPTREEMQEIEVTSRLYVENGAHFMMRVSWRSISGRILAV